MIIAGEAFNIVVEGEPNAPAVVLSHALGTNLHVFDKQVPALRQHFRVVRYDLRGHGGSVVSHGPYSISQLGHDALAILDALRLDKVHWIGLSEGGMVGQWLLTKAPERIERAILANTAAQIGGAEVWNERIRLVHERGVEALAPSVIENWFTRQFRERHPEEVRRFEEGLLATAAEGYAATCAAVRDADLRNGLRSITHPVLVVVGRHDPVTPPGVGALIASSINGAKLVTLEAAHLSPVEAAAAFNQAALEFLTGQADRPAETGETPAPEPAHTEAPPKPHKPRPPRRPPQPAAQEHLEVVEPKPEPRPEPVAAPPVKRPTPPKPPKKAAEAPPEPVVARAMPQRKRPAKKAAAKKTAARRTAAKKPVARKPARKPTAKRHAVKKTAARRGAAKKTIARKPARKVAAKKSATRKAKRTPAKKSPMKKMRRMQPRRSSPRRPAKRRR